MAIRKFSSVTMGLVILLFCLSFAAVSAQEGKTNCSIPPVEEFTNTTLTCHFPEDLGVTKKDFTIYHYVPNGTAESAVDCWWIKGNLDCYTKPSFQYNKAINTQLNVTIHNVTPLHTGSYACQVAGYSPNLLETCLFNLKNDKENTCEVSKDKSEANATLICKFSEDIARRQLNISVYKHIDLHKKVVIKCWWEDGQTRCEGDSGYVYISTVSSDFTILIPDVTKETSGNYSCWHSDYRTLPEKLCVLDEHNYDHSNEEISSPLIIILISSLLSAVVVVSAFVILLLRFRRKLSSRFQQRRRQRPHDEHKSETEMMLEKQEVQTQKFQKYLEEKVREMYADILSSCYCVPPIYFNKCRYKKETVKSTSVLVYESCDPSEVQYDRDMHHVLHCLRHVGEQRQEPMFVLTQFRYKDYLNNVPQNHVRHSVRRVKKEDKNHKCFDLLIIHKKFGFTAVVVKTVSGSPGKQQRDKQTTDETLTAQCKEAISQLKKARNMVNYLMKDETECPEVRLVLILPNLSSSSLAHDVTSEADTVQFMCADDLPDFKSTFDIGTEQKLGQWFDRLMERTRGDKMMSDELYVKAISRFCGPATQSHLESEDDLLLPKTLAEAVLITGKLYESNILHPYMLDLLEEERLILAGPPNTGKTRMLMLAAEKWGASELYVISGKRTQNNFVKQQLRANHIECDFNNKREVEETVKMLCEKKDHNTLCVLAYDVSGQNFKHLCTRLKQKQPDICMWATARTMQDKQVPQGWRLVTLTHALTCPPAVVRAAVGASYTIPGADNESLDYLPPTDGPPVKYIYHKKDQGDVSHDCTQCGENVAEFLKLLITKCGNSTGTSPDAVSAATGTVITESLSSTLQDNDVLVLFECDLEQGASFLTGLLNAGITVHTLADKEDMKDFTEDNKSACAMHIEQLDRYRMRRQIVVYVESKSWNGDRYTKWRGITSCTSQLIVVSKNFA
ncbi:uncharacterized protein LOC112575168 isoform X2 [Pomacea canaliculata]|uniref:uncharacterized protein LOC112575168 isoform X2 n=1 Tax=Pomacea canaliculata TaxID=400727 RepID=UPI000D73819B|nr:uncharacterized protein LOC112575168 isoform X2 [Pomacea canaliculata]